MKFSCSLITASLVLAGLLSACGGGGGGSAAAPAATPAALASGNMTVAAQDTAAGAFMPISSSQTLTGAQVTDESMLFGIARDQLDKLPIYTANAAANSTLAGAVTSQTVACTPGTGSLTVSVSVANSNGVPSAGDSVTITSNSCNFGSGPLSGSLTFTINALSGTYPTAPYNASFTMAFGNFTVTGSQISASVNGSLSLSLNVTGTHAYTSSISTPSLTVSGTYGGATRTRTLSNYAATSTQVPDATYTYLTSLTINGSLTSTALNSQTISYATTSPFVVRGTDHYPTSGVMVITGASNSKLRVTALNNVQVTEELDANGDGTYEVGPTTVNWNTLY